jgi:hypothetical protein
MSYLKPWKCSGPTLSSFLNKQFSEVTEVYVCS